MWGIWVGNMHQWIWVLTSHIAILFVTLFLCFTIMINHFILWYSFKHLGGCGIGNRN
jgi:hypothetical protein